MKKYISLILAGITALSLFTSCGKGETKENDTFFDYDNESVVSVEGESSDIHVKEKKYDYEDANVELLRVESRTEKNYTIKITAHFIDEGGNEIKSEYKTFEGFPAGYENYFLFQPRVKYDKFIYEITTKEFNGETYAEYVVQSDTYTPVRASAVTIDENAELYENEDEYRTQLDVKFPLECNYPDNSCLRYSADFILFNCNGEIFWIDDSFQSGDISSDVSIWNGPVHRVKHMYDTFWNEYKLPEELEKNTTGIVAVKFVKRAQ